MPTWQLLRFDQISGLVDVVTEQRVTAAANCSTDGVAEWSSCDDDTLCVPGQLCAGYTRGFGMCMPTSQRGIFHNTDSGHIQHSRCD